MICKVINFIKRLIFFGVFYECQVQDFFEILELKFTSVNEYFKI